MAYVEDLTAVGAAFLLDDDIVYIGKPGDVTPDRKMTVAALYEALLTDRLVVQTATWTPVIRGASTSGTYTPTVAAGRCSWARVGPVVHVFGRIVGFSVATGGTGNMEVLGNVPDAPVGRIIIGTMTISNPVTGTNPIVCQLRRSNDAFEEFRVFASADGVSVVPISQVQTTTTMDFAVSYMVL